MKILFATAPFYRKIDTPYIEPLLGMFLLPKILRDCGCHVDVALDLDARLEQEPKEIVAQALNADLICLSAMSLNWPYIKEFMELVAQAGKHPPMIVGGVHPTLVPDHVMRSSPVDIAVVGEGEHVLLELVDHFRGLRSLEEIKGIYYRHAGQILSTPKRELLTSEELGQLPRIKWDNFSGAPKYMSVQTSRGCLMNCAFCAVPFHQSWRPFPLHHILSSLETCLKVTHGNGPKHILFADDCFTPNQQFATDVLKATTEQFPQVRLHIEARVRDLLRPGFLETLAESNVQSVQVGIECGYDEGLKKITKGLKIEEVEELGRRAKTIGVEQIIRYSYIIGFPWETIAEMKATIDFAFFIANHYGGAFQIAWWLTMPGNPLFKQICDSYSLDESIFDHRDWCINHDVFLRTHPWLTVEEILHIRQYCLSLALSCKPVHKMGSAFSLPWADVRE